MKSMHNNRRRARQNRGVALVLALALMLGLGIGGGIVMTSLNRPASAEATEAESTQVEAPQAEVAMPTQDTSPAIYVAQKNADSVVGILTYAEGWSRGGGVQNTLLGQGSGVVIAEGGYVLTNNHVVEDGSAWKVLMPDGSKVDAVVTGMDSAMDLAVLQVTERADELVPVSVGSSENLPVGSTVVAIGNPGGEILANTVTQGIISGLERTSMSGSNTTRNVNYIQHDAAINSGNSGGGLFDFQGNLIGINTKKYIGNTYTSVAYENLSFAIPVESAYPIAQQLIEYGKVIRPQIGVTVMDQDGPDEPMNDYAPASVCITGVNPGSAGEAANLKQYDFITAVDGQRVTNRRELSTLLDTYKPGDTVTLTIVRYNNVSVANANDSYYGSPYGYGFGYGFPFGNYYYGNGGDGSSLYDTNAISVGGGYTTFDVEVTLEEKE